MKTSAVSVAVFVAIVVSSWFIVGRAQEELAAPDRAVVQLRVRIDAIRFRPGEGFSRFLAPRGTDLARGKLARKLLEQHRAGDTLWLVGTFDFGRVGHVRLPRDVTIRGLGPGRTRLQNAWTEAAVACAFELADGVLLEDLTIESTCRTDEQQVLVGYAGTVSNAHATIRGCDIFGKAWAVYAWATGSDNYLTLEDCRIKSGRQCVSACGSNPSSQFVDVRHCLLEVDPSRSTYDGAVAADVLPIVARGGTLRVVDTTVVARGNKHIARVAAVTDHYGTPSPHPVIEVVNLTSWLAPGGMPFPQKLYDLDRRHGTIRRVGGTGSGAGGTFLTNGTIQ